MKNANLWIVLIGLTALAGCGDYSNNKQTSAGNYGSATDISKNGEMPTNSANTADNGLGGPVQRETGNYRSQRTPAQSDEELARQIKVALTTGSIGTTGSIAENQLTKIDVQVKNGNVTLSGPVASDAERGFIEKQVADFKGVNSVQNNLSVGGRDVQEKPLQPLVPRGAGNE
jgi:hypothetical protein